VSKHRSFDFDVLTQIHFILLHLYQNSNSRVLWEGIQRTFYPAQDPEYKFLYVKFLSDSAEQRLFIPENKNLKNILFIQFG